MGRTLEMGVEKDRLDERVSGWRWWFYLHVPDAEGRPQDPRQGVQGNGFSFARGGRAPDRHSADLRLRRAWDDAEREFRLWQKQPSHALGPNGELVPLGEVVGRELEPA